MVARPRENPSLPLLRRPLGRPPILVPPLPLRQLTVFPPLLRLQPVTRPHRLRNEVEAAHERSAARFPTVSEPSPVQPNADYLILPPYDASPPPRSPTRFAPLRSLLPRRRRKTDPRRSVDGPARGPRLTRRTLPFPFPLPLLLPLPLLPRLRILLLQSPQPPSRDPRVCYAPIIAHGLRGASS